MAGRAILRALVAMPRRQLNILRWTRGREFRHVHGVSMAWMDSHFELIERGAPWLNHVGSDVWDFCRGAVQPFFRLAGGFAAGAGCIREVTAVYGFDGPLLPLLRSLDQALPPAGWKLGTPALPQSWADLDPGYAATTEKLARHRTRWMIDRQVSLTWGPTEALGYPPDGEGTPPWGQPPLTPRMRISWSSRGQETGWRGDPNKQRPTSRGYVAVEVSESDVVQLLDEALARYEHAFTVTINLAYYSNPNARARRHRMPRYLLPTRRSWWVGPLRVRMTGMAEPKSMVVRTWSATADAAGAGDYSSYFAGTLLPELRKLTGFRGAYLLRRELGENGLVELTTHTFWESAEAIRDFAGDDITRSVVEPEAQAMLLGFDRTATHRIVAVDARG